MPADLLEHDLSGTLLDTRGANGVYFVTVDRFKAASGNRKATVRIANVESEGRAKDVTAATGDVEANLVYPLLRGKDVQHWVAAPVAHMILPHDPDEVDRVLTTNTLRRDYPNAFSWLRRNKTFLANRKAPPSRNWNMTSSGDDWCRIDGPLRHMQSGFSVVVRELAARPAAALVEERFDMKLNRAVTPLIDHKLMLCTVQTREEALYLVAMINSTPMQDLLESFVNTTSVSPKSMKRLPIPDFDSTNPDMSDLVVLAEAVTAAADPVAHARDTQELMDASALKVVSAAPDYEPQPTRARRGTPRRPVGMDELGLFDV